MKEKIGRESMKGQKYVLGDNKKFIWHTCMATLGDPVGGIVRL